MFNRKLKLKLKDFEILKIKKLNFKILKYVFSN